MSGSLTPSEAPSFILYEFLSEMQSAPPTGRIIPTGINRILRIVKGRKAEFYPTGGKARIWLHATTHNQRESLEPVAKALGNDGYWANLSDPFAAWGSALDRQLLRALDRNVEPAPHLAELYSLAIAEAALFRRAFIESPPAGIVTSNDHSPRHMALILAANRVGVPLAYLQHAAVGGVEPPLENFDLALLHGAHAEDHYRRRGASAKRTYLVGAPKLDEAYSAPEVDDADAIGVCPALDAPAGAIETVLKKISKSTAKERVVLRLHPRAKQRAPSVSGIEISDPAKEGTATFLKRIKILVVDDSNIAIEALAFGVQPLRLSFDGPLRDQYGIGEDPAFAQWETDIERLPTTIEKALNIDRKAVQAASFHYFQCNGSLPSSEHIAMILRWAYLNGPKPKQIGA